MEFYRSEGLAAFQGYENAAAEEHQLAHELAQCAKIDVYSLIAVDLFNRVNAARLKTIAAFRLVESFKS